jgi:hypothetical protein
MCHLSLEVWTNTLSICFICLFTCFVLFLFVYICFCLYIIFFFVMLLIGHNLYRNCGLHVIGVFNLFEHCISLEILVFLFMSWIRETPLV